MRALMAIVFAFIWVVPVWAAAPAHGSWPSVAATTRVDFLGKPFERKWKSTDGPVKRYEYYPGKQTPNNWFEMVEFQVYPMRADGNGPRAHAVRLAEDFKRHYPYMKFALYADKSTGAALLDFFYPTSVRKDKDKQYFEFDAFKFFRDPVSGHTLCFHYAKNIEAPGPDHPMSDVAADLNNTRHKVIPAMARFGAYRE